MKVKLSELQWTKIENALDISGRPLGSLRRGWDVFDLDFRDGCYVYLFKLKNNEIITVGRVNEGFGACDDCIGLSWRDVVAFCKIEFE